MDRPGKDNIIDHVIFGRLYANLLDVQTFGLEDLPRSKLA